MQGSAITTVPGWLPAGSLLEGRYRLDGPLGSGGFGQVYRAVQLPLERGVAVKVLSVAAAMAPDAMARFRREAELARRLEHPNTVRIIDFGVTDGGLPFIVWELLRGRTLGELLATQGPLSPAEVSRIATQMLKSLMEAHALGVIHRDIKPANVFLTAHAGEPNFVKVLDFGIAKDLAQDGAGALPQASADAAVDPIAATFAAQPGSADSESLTRASRLVGTPRYMAPEQVLGGTIGPSTDLYAVGLVMAEMLTARPVFDGMSAMAMCLAQASGAPVPLTRNVIESPLGPLIQRATAKRTDLRFRTANEMLDRLESLDVHRTSGRPQSSGPLPALAHSSAPAFAPTVDATRGTTPALRHRRWPLIGIAGGAIALAIAVSLGFVFWPTSPRRRERPDVEEDRRAPTAIPASTVDMRSRAIPAYTGKTLQERMVSAGYAIAAKPMEEGGDTWKIVIATGNRGTCGGSVQYYDYAGDPKSADTLVASLKELHGDKYPIHRVNDRVLLVAIVKEGQMERSACADEMLDVLTR